MADALVYKNEFGLVLSLLPHDEATWFDFIEERLIEVHEPKTRLEWSAVAELADARRELFQLERAYQRRCRHEADQAAELFDRHLMDDFFKLDRLWRKNVHAAHAVYTRNIHAVTAIARNWRTLADQLAPEAAGVDIQQALDAVLAEGLACKAQELTAEAWWIMGRWLACCPNQEESIVLWLKKSGLKKGDAWADRIRDDLKAFPNADQARAELHQRAAKRARSWQGRLAELQKKVEKERQAQAEMAMGIGEKGQTAEMRSARSILKFQRDRVEKVERKLAALQKERRVMELKDQPVPGLISPLIRAKMAKDRAAQAAAVQAMPAKPTATIVESNQMPRSAAANPHTPTTKRPDETTKPLIPNGLCLAK